MFIKLLRYDIRTGILDRLRGYIAPAALYAFAFVNYIVRLNAYIRTGNALSLGRSLGDALLFIFGGMREYDPSIDRRFSFPALWMLLYMLLAYLVLYYPHRDLEENGQNVLIRTGGRGLWWMSKCAWNTLSVILYFLLGWGITVLGCICTGIPLTLHLSPNINILFEMTGYNMLHPDELTAEILLLPLAVMAALMLMQMALSLFVRPVYSYMITAAVLLAGTYYLSPLFIGNYAMPLRSIRMIRNGVEPKTGLIMSAVLAAVSVAAGLVRFRRYDILSREN